MARFSLPKSVNLKAADWLPGVALFLCLGLFAMAGVLLIGANADPVTGQSAYVTGVSAQGYQGLKRLLAARGHAVAVNRDEDGIYILATSRGPKAPHEPAGIRTTNSRVDVDDKITGVNLRCRCNARLHVPAPDVRAAVVEYDRTGRQAVLLTIPFG